MRAMVAEVPFMYATSFRWSLSLSLPPLSLRRKTLVAACHVAPKIWKPFKSICMGGVAVQSSITMTRLTVPPGAVKIVIVGNVTHRN